MKQGVSVILVCLATSSLVFAATTHEDEAFVPMREPNRQDMKLARFTRAVKNVNVPGVYDMIKDGSSLGINVLSGFVKVERGQEAERSGLVGPRPLSVRIFGIPVYERGVRIREPVPESGVQPESEPRPESEFESEAEPRPEPPRFPESAESVDEDDLQFEERKQLAVAQKQV